MIEVVVALLILEVGVVGVLGTLVLANRTLRRAERLERASALSEAMLDSLGGGAARAGSGKVVVGDVHLDWSVDSTGTVDLSAVDEHGVSVLSARSWAFPR